MFTAVVVLVGVLLVLLAVPLDVAFRLRGIEAFGGQVSLRWGFGLLRFRIPVPGARKAPSGRATAAQGTAPPAGAGKRGQRARVLGALRQAAFRRRACRLVLDLIRAARIRELRLWMRLGLGDPADTGRLWAMVGPLHAAAGSMRTAQVRIEPDFIDATCEFEVEGRLRLIPVQYLALAIGFVLSPPAIRAWRSMPASHA